MIPQNKKKTLFLFTLILFFGITFQVQGTTLGGNINFYIDSSYDISGRSQLTAALIKTTPKLYFYIDQNWWNSQNYSRQGEILNKLESLSQEFENKIYPNLTSAFGSEWKPGVDGDERIYILLHPMKEEAGGYFRTADEFLKIQFPESNEKEMVYLNANQADSPQLKTLLAHEFMHLINFNQKEKIQGVTEETWLNEARAEYTSTFLGYDEPYEGSNLQKRVKAFLEEPSDSITEWQNKKYDYGSVNLFIQYLVDHYSIAVLNDSIKSKKVGIPSINEALAKYGFKACPVDSERSEELCGGDFSQIFTDWLISVLVNDCSLGQKYCYLNKNLKIFKISPTINFLPLTGKSTLSVTNITKNWSGNWQKFIGGKGVLKFEFSSLIGLNFKVPYLIQDKEGKYSISFLVLNKEQKGEILIPDFSSKNTSLIIIPSLQTKISGFDGVEATYPFSFTVSILERTPEEEAKFIQELLAQIESLKKQIAEVQAKINAILASRGQKISCTKFERDLYFGMMNSSEVSCLQQFLKSQGSEIYLEGLTTGNFLSLTQVAVIRFQEKYANEILNPLGLEKGTGYVGEKSRTKINQLLGL